MSTTPPNGDAQPPQNPEPEHRSETVGDTTPTEPAPRYAPPAYAPPPASPPPGTPPTPPQMPAGQPAAEERTNTLAIVALISSFFISLLGIILGHIALSQIKKSGEKGRGLALAGTIIGYVFTGLAILIVGLVLFMFSLGIGQILMFDQAMKEQQQYQYEEPYEYEDPDDEWNEGTGDDFDYESPWIGTPHEEFCEKYTTESTVLTPEQYREYAYLVPDEELAEKFRQVADIFDDSSSLDASEQGTLIADLVEEAGALCYDW